MCFTQMKNLMLLLIFLFSCTMTIQDRMQEPNFLKCYTSINQLEYLKYASFEKKSYFLGFYYSEDGVRIFDKKNLLDRYFLKKEDLILETDECSLSDDRSFEHSAYDDSFAREHYIPKYLYLFVGSPEEIKTKIRTVRILRNGKERKLNLKEMNIENIEKYIYPHFLSSSGRRAMQLKYNEDTVIHDGYEEYDEELYKRKKLK